ncbi:sensor histidine kinase [Paenibacillus methanolicus]|uniref:Two-component system sensor histidine kinase YesM n=1 Tax=Paenibacillus methanolicus TaxID=582686 RepID=A0A5S5CDV2_9BACL|nr:sensor histidine kinase [Paenibacillus methanolicus]TYP76496.1 two-component system sensor histidine kinase YesM [Paenibacillus methanolicus]
MPRLNKLAFRSLRFQLVAGVLLVTLPLIALLIASNHYSIQVVRGQIAQSSQNTVSLYMNQIDNTLEETGNYLYTLAAQETSLMYLKLWEGNYHQVYNQAKIEMYNKLSDEIATQKQVDTLFIYSSANDDLIQTTTGRSTIEERRQITEEVKRQLRAQRAPGSAGIDKWSVLEASGDHYLCLIVRTGTVYVGALMHADSLRFPFHLVDLGTDGKVVLTDSRNRPLSDAEFFAADPKLQLAFDKTGYDLTGQDDRYLLVGETSGEGSFHVVALIPNEAILEKLPFLQRIFSGISIGAIALVLLFLTFMRKVILAPVKNLVLAMRKVSGGHLDARLAEHSATYEMELMNKTYNNMVGQIQALKISVYEEQLNVQRAELKQLQLQVNPHFFLNSLNIIYNLASVKDFALIKEMSLCLVKYFRYTFRSAMALVELREEIAHIRNYLNIQALRFPDQLTYRIDVDESCARQPIPLLMIQPFVENAVKHAFVMDKPLDIAIEVRSEADAMLNIVIQDNGRGFPPDVLAKLQAKHSLSNEQGEHIGIWNVQHRLQLMFQDRRSGIRFSNIPDRGARIELWLPRVEA